MRGWMALAVLALLAQAARVVELDVVGNRRVPEETILLPLEPLLTQPLDDRRLAEAVRRLHETGLFSDVEIRSEELAPGGIRLVVAVVEKPLLGEIRWTGAKIEPPLAELTRVLRDEGIELRPSAPIGEAESRRAERILSDLLGDRYQVSTRLEPAEDDRVDLIVHIERRDLPRVRELELAGNEAVSDSSLRSAMRIVTSGPLAWLTDRAEYSERRLEENVERLRSFYRSRGFFTVRVGPAEVEAIAEGAVRVRIPIEEGARYTLDAVELDPGLILTDEELADLFPLRSGDLYDAVAVREFASVIERAYQEAGFPAARIDLREEVIPARRAIFLAIDAEPGPPYRFGRIEFRGNLQLPDDRLRRHLAVEERERFDIREIEASVRQLMASGFFRSVEPEIELDPQSLQADLTFHLVEARRFSYLFGGGVTDREGLTGGAQLLARNLLGRGDVWSWSGDLGGRFQNGAFGYQEAFTLARRLRWGLAFERQGLEFPDETSDELTRFAALLEGPAGSRWQFQTGFRWIRFELGSDLDEEVPFLTPFLGREFRTRRADLRLGLEGRDRPAFPTRGRRFLLETELAGGFLGGDVHLGRLGLRFSEILPLDRRPRHLLVASGRFERVWPFGSTLDEGLPRFERLFLGGENDLRAFGVRDVGPRTPEGIVVGGDRLYFASLEYHHLLGERLRLVGFFDLGDVLAREDIGLENDGPRYDAGAEMQLLLPIVPVPLRLGYGVKLDPLPGEDRDRVFFSLALRF